MPAYLPMWSFLHAGEVALCALWTVMALVALSRRRLADAAVLAILAALGSAWLGGELTTVAGGGLVGDVSPAVRVEAASLVGLATLVALRPGRPGRSALSLLPLVLAFRGLAGLVAGVVLAARGVLDRGAPARRWALAAVVLLAVAAGARTDKLAVRRAISGAFELSRDECVVATEWVADATTLAAWASASRWLASSEPPPPRPRVTSPQRARVRREHA